MKALLASLLALAVWAPACAQARGDEVLSKANEALQAGEADKALGLLDPVSQSGQAVAEAHNLRCRVYFTLENWDAALRECQQAVNADGGNSDYHMWLGRALGEKADRASFLSAYSLGKQVRVEFETAVRLNPRNAEALSDLGEFYTDAPGIVGGGDGKAEAIASQLDKVDPVRAAKLRAGIAESQNDYVTAEREFRQAIAMSQHPAFEWMALASFYRRRARWTEMEAAVQSGVKAAQRDRHAGVALFNGASVLSRAGRDLPLAARMFQDYLDGVSKTEEAPAFVACTRLARVDAQLGDFASARNEKAAALGLAQEYAPAQSLKF